MSLRQVTEVLGGPSAIQTNVLYNMVSTDDYERGVRHQQRIEGFDFYYSPDEGLKFDGHNGAGYQNLLLRLDSNYQLLAWQWHRPIGFMHDRSSVWYKPK